ncbi:Striatin-interacting protein 1 -like protein [Halotydeus destructor]|nr:Striatin-interacting protein 1 -like protein [Halotydeus destructor]
MWNVANENVDIDYVYCDTDVHSNEMAELYSYTEEPDFAINKTSFEQLMLDYGFPLKWTEMTDHQQDRTLELLADGLELTSKSSRMQSLRAVLYLAQGVFGECSKMFEQEDLSRKNTFILYSKGFFTLSLQLLLLEIDITLSPTTPKKLPSHLGDSRDMRLILSLIYTFVEVMRTGRDADSEQDVLLRKEFLEELCQPVGPTNELLSITLFQMVTKFCNGSAPQLPVRKVLLLLWKVILATLGGTEKLRSLKDQYRREAGLAPCPDDTVEVARTMRAASPPASAAEVMEAQNQRKINRPFKRQMLIKQPSVAAEDSEGDSNDGNDETDAQRVDDSNDADVQVRKNNPPEEKLDIGARPASPRPSNAGQFPVLSRLASAGEHSEFPLLSKGLPWAPKVRHRDLDQFLDHTRSKFIGYLLPGDRSTTAGLPGPDSGGN